MSLISGGYGTDSRGTYATTEYDAYPLIPEEIAREIGDGVTEGSAALTLFKRLPNMSSRTYRMPILGTLGNAGFTCNTVNDDLVNGSDTQVDDERMNELRGQPYGIGNPGEVPNEGMPGLKETHQMAWENVFIVAEPMAIVLPVPDDVLDDSQYDLWEAMKPRIIEAFHQKIDSAIIFGQGRPVTWPTGIVPTAIARGQVVQEGTGVDIAEDVSNLMGILEQQAYDPSGFMAAPSIKATLRNLRDNNGYPIFVSSLQQNAAATLHGLPVSYVKNNTFVTNTTRLICGKLDEAVYSIRTDMRFQIFDQGVITDDHGRVVINLMQQDCKAMRVVMRLGYAIPNTIHKLRADRSGYPFAVLTA